MTPNQLYKLVPQRVDKDATVLILDPGSHYCHIPELEDLRYDLDLSKNERVSIHYHREHRTDYRRYWRLASVWFDDKPVMVIQNAGREGDDHTGNFITDVPLYREMVQYLSSFLKITRFKDEERIKTDPDKDVKGLNDFYGECLEDP